MTVLNYIAGESCYAVRACACGVTFQPSTSRHRLCSWQCRFLEIAQNFESTDTCWEWPKSTGSHGYGQLMIDKIPHTSHTLSYRFHTGEIPAGMVVMHSCDNRKCINPQHLLLGTHEDNIRDMWSKGRQRPNSVLPTGDAHHNSRFTKVQQEEILQNFAGQSFRSIAKDLNCSHKLVSKIFGSSNGSQNKDVLLAQSVPAK